MNKELDYLSERLSQQSIKPNWRDRAAFKKITEYIERVEFSTQYENKHLLRFMTWAFSQILYLKTEEIDVSPTLIKSIIWKIESILYTDHSAWSKTMAVDLYCKDPKGPTIEEHQKIIEKTVEDILILNLPVNDA